MENSRSTWFMYQYLNCGMMNEFCRSKFSAENHSDACRTTKIFVLCENIYLYGIEIVNISFKICLFAKQKKN